jgi:5-hydroxyisourate hydrolase-like protein (transthyretin family)
MKMLRIVLFSLTCLAMTATASDPVKLTVHVASALSGRPVDRASVIVRFKSGIGVNLKKIQTSWETKTNQEGNVTLPTMPQGQIMVQVIADYYQTFGGTFTTDKAEQTIDIKLNAPQPQYSEDAKTTSVPK